MAVSADLLRLAIVRESTPGVTPATPGFQLLRVTSESIAFTPETQLSNELNPARQLTDVIVSGGSSGGDIAFEVSSNLGFEMLLEAALANTWATDRLTVGTKLLTHTIEKRFTLDEAAVDVSARHEFNRVERALVDSMTLTFTPGGPATGTVTILGGAFHRDDLALTDATYSSAGDLPVIVGSGILPITFTIDGTDYDSWCLSNLVVTIRNNGRAIACLGSEGANEVVLGRMECEISGDIYMNNEAKQLMQAFLDKAEMGFAFTATDAQGNAYTFTFPRVRVSAATEVAGGTNQDVILTTTLQALVDTIATPAVDTCLVIDRLHSSPSWPVSA